MVSHMYLMMKVQKPMISTRAIINTNNTALGPEFIWVDYHVQNTKQLIPTYPQDSKQIFNKLKRHAPLSPGAKLFTGNSVAMYPIINTDEGL